MTDPAIGCAKTPLSDLLRSIPQDAVLNWANPEEGRQLWQLGSESAPIGRLAHEAADALDAAAWNHRTPAPEGEVARLLAYANSHKLPDEGPIGAVKLKWGDLRAGYQTLYAPPVVPVGSGTAVTAALIEDALRHRLSAKDGRVTGFADAADDIVSIIRNAALGTKATDTGTPG